MEPILIQVERVLATPLFNRSQRYTGFLRYVVEYALKEPSGSPKERTIGIEVFGRKPSYDCDADPVVRICAAEVRRRLIAYYAEAGHGSELRIELPRGHYRPVFTLPPVGGSLERPRAERASPAGSRSPATERPTGATQAKSGRATSAPAEPAVGEARHRPRWRWALGAVAVAVLAAAIGVGWGRRPSRAHAASVIFDEFWAPALHSRTGTAIAVGDLTDLWQIAGLKGAAPADLGPDIRWTGVNWEDAHSAASLSTILGPHLRYTRSSQTTAAAMGAMPVVLVGAFDNSWTLRLTAGLPLRFQGGFGNACCSITNLKGQSFTADQNHDYAIVARLKGGVGGAERYIVAGIGPSGTLAASELVSSPAQIAQLAKFAPPGWTKLNAELLVRTDLASGQPGPPVVQQAIFW